MRDDAFYVYDYGNCCVRETVETTACYFFRCNDLSGMRGGAGGLLATRIGNAWFFPIYDANGNITDYVDESGATVAHREYDAFGKTLAATGPMVNDLNFWFSTKYLDHETGFYYYGYRHYAPKFGCWLSKDPIGEDGGLKLNGFLENNPCNNIEYLGLSHWITEINRLGEFSDEPYPHCLEPGYYRHCLSSCILRKLFGLFLRDGISTPATLLIAMKYGGDIPFIDWDSGSMGRARDRPVQHLMF